MPTKRTAQTTHRRKKQPQQHQWALEKTKALRQCQARFAEQLGRLQQTVSLWECGHHPPKGASINLPDLIAEKASFKYEADLKEKSKSAA